ncbi:hypothetical protein, partial [Pseudorhodobacter sp.]|uniref:hypothetical protein n=1 Tax=Pseudorhodobacter sp. TaxID=1934400 RepID=UPI002648ADE6
RKNMMSGSAMIYSMGGLALTGAVAAGAYRLLRRPELTAAELVAAYATPLPKPQAALSVYHLGHSLVGRDMPVMLDQLVAAAGYSGHRHHSQLGWGASLDQHWRGAEAVPGFATENAHANHRPAQTALASGEYDAVVLTEMVEIRDAIRHHDSAKSLVRWAKAARAGRPDVRLYLYETWHRLDDPQGWLHRIDSDRVQAWEGVLLRQAMAVPGVGVIHVIPGGQVLAAVVRAAEAGEIPGLSRREALFASDATGQVDPVHLNDLGNHIIALTHFATLYQQSPVGLPHALRRADGQPATPLPQTAALPIERLVWQVVSGYALTGVAG